MSYCHHDYVWKNPKELIDNLISELKRYEPAISDFLKQQDKGSISRCTPKGSIVKLRLQDSSVYTLIIQREPNEWEYRMTLKGSFSNSLSAYEITELDDYRHVEYFVERLAEHLIGVHSPVFEEKAASKMHTKLASTDAPRRVAAKNR
jgi:hypothetical protein